MNDQRSPENTTDAEQIKDSLRQEYMSTLDERVHRYMKVLPHGIIPYEYFSLASSECSVLFRDGHYFAGIALTQAVAEALVRFMCESNQFRAGSDYEANVGDLFKRGFISSELRDRLLEIYTERNDYHHLNPKVELDRLKLEELAEKKLKLLNGVEKELFEFTVKEGGKFQPKRKRYWKIKDGEVEVFLRLGR